MSRDLPSFPAVRAFEAAARHGSFKDAAHELHVTQSAVSHQVKSLEEFLGTTLFRRETRGVALTEEGVAYLERVSTLLDQLSDATRAIRNRGAAGSLRIRSTPAFASRWLVPRLNDFNAVHPEIELHIESAMEPANFSDDGVDVEIRYGSHASNDFYTVPFLESSRFPVASPALIEQHPPLARPSDLGRFVLLHNEVDDAWAQWLRCAGADRVDSEPGPRFAHCNLTLRAATEGQGVALAFGALVTQDLADGTLVRLFDLNLPQMVIYSFACPADYLAQPRVAAFHDWLVSTARLDNTHAQTQAEIGSTAAAG